MLKNFLSKTLLSMVLDEKARDKLAQRKTAEGSGKPGGAANSRADQIKQIQAAGKGMMTPERAELIRNALEVRKAKAKIFDDLNDEQKRKLYALAVKTFLGQGGDGK